MKRSPTSLATERGPVASACGVMAAPRLGHGLNSPEALQAGPAADTFKYARHGRAYGSVPVSRMLRLRQEDRELKVILRYTAIKATKKGGRKLYV